MIGSQLLRYQDNQRYLCFDIESNGLNLAASKPWQLAYAICTNRHIEATVVRHIAWPDLEMSEDAARVNRFDRKKYESLAEDAKDVWKDFGPLLEDENLLIVGHNLYGFDCYVVNTWRRLMGLPVDWSFMPRIVDTLCLARAYRHGLVPDLKDFAAWQYKTLSIKGSRAKGMGCSLGAMAREFQIPYDERLAHEASYDIGINHEVLKKLLWSVEV